MEFLNLSGFKVQSLVPKRSSRPFLQSNLKPAFPSVQGSAPGGMGLALKTGVLSHLGWAVPVTLSQKDSSWV